MTTLYKILVDGKSCHGGDMTWSLPRETSPGRWEPGEWETVTGDLSMCERGLHLTDSPFDWYKWGCACYEAETTMPGAWDHMCHKMVCRTARLLRPVDHPTWWTDATRFVATLSANKWLKPDHRPLRAWKLFLADSWAAAGDAAWDAAWDAARDAARDAAWAAAGDAVWDAAWVAARDAARAAAWAAAGDAAWDAAWVAARDASLYARCLIVGDTAVGEKLIEYAAKRMNVWEKGYALMADVDGVLYVYGENE